MVQVDQKGEFFMNESTEFKKIVESLKACNGFLTRDDINNIVNDESIDEGARLDFHIMLNYNAITVDDLLRKFFNYFRFDDINRPEVTKLVRECLDLNEAGELSRDAYIVGDLDYIGNCPDHVDRFTNSDAVNLLLPFI